MNKQTQDRNAAILWARSIVDRSHEYYILDTETTGLDNPEVIELAAINLTGEMLVNQRFNPITPISTAATYIHGMTNADLATSPKWKTASYCFDTILFRRKLLIYNYTFDHQAIQNTYNLHQISFPGFRGGCVMRWYSQYIGEWDNRRRSYRWQQLPAGNHSALGDCLATLEVIKMMARSLIVEDLDPDRPSQIAPGPIGNEEKIAS
jgi:DNA polymerase III subunit epsilon